MDYLDLTKKQILEGVKEKFIDMADITESQKDDREIVLEVFNNSWILKYSPQSLENNTGIVFQTIKQDGKVLIYVSEELRDDKDVVLEVVKQNGLLLQYSSKRLRDDKDVVLKAMTKNMTSFKFSSARLQNNKELLELLEKTIQDKNEFKIADDNVKKWYEERMEVLANIRDKELMEKSIIINNKITNKIKF